jgi:hypothetical protein
MSGVSSRDMCPICKGEAETYLETRTNESEFVCQGCGYLAYAEIQARNGAEYWVETVWYPISQDGRVARPETYIPR